MWVPSLGWEDPLEEGMATHFSILTWKIRGAWWATVRTVAKCQIWRKWLSTHVCIVGWVLLINNVMTISGESKRAEPYIFIHPLPPTFPPIQAVTEFIFVFVSLFINVILVWRIPDLQKKVSIVPKISIWKFYDKQEELYWNHKKTTGEGNGNSLQYSCLENPMDRGAWQAGLSD